MELTERKKRILKSIVDEYIRSGEPVGSKYITGSIPDTLSSATVRNEMSELSDMGYLDKPHTSAGRVPTTKGIRTYIEALMEDYKLSLEELSVLNELLDFKVGEFGKLLEAAARAVSHITNYTAISVLKPPADRIEKLKAVYIDSCSFLLIVKCSDGNIKTKTVNVAACNERELELLTAALNLKLPHLTAEQINLNVILEVETAAGDASHLVTPALRALNDMLSSDTKEDVKVQGLTKLLSYPEFYDVSKAKEVLEVLEQKQTIVNRFIEGMPGRPNIAISGEGLAPEDASVVFYPITVSGQTIGAIGVIGPKRMDYKKVIANLEYFASGLTDELNGTGGGRNDNGETE